MHDCTVEPLYSGHHWGSTLWPLYMWGVAFVEGFYCLYDFNPDLSFWSFVILQVVALQGWPLRGVPLYDLLTYTYINQARIYQTAIIQNNVMTITTWTSACTTNSGTLLLLLSITDQSFALSNLLNRLILKGERSYDGGRSSASSDSILPITGASLNPWPTFTDNLNVQLTKTQHI